MKNIPQCTGARNLTDVFTVRMVLSTTVALPNPHKQTRSTARVDTSLDLRPIRALSTPVYEHSIDLESRYENGYGNPSPSKASPVSPGISRPGKEASSHYNQMLKAALRAKTYRSRAAVTSNPWTAVLQWKATLGTTSRWRSWQYLHPWPQAHQCWHRCR